MGADGHQTPNYEHGSTTETSLFMAVKFLIYHSQISIIAVSLPPHETDFNCLNL